MQHHKRHIHCTPVTRKVPCHQQDIVHGRCRSGEDIRSCNQTFHLVGYSQAWHWGVAGVTKCGREYDNARSKVRVGCNLSEEFSMKVSVHQGSCLAPYCSSRFENRKIYLQMTFSSSPNRWGNCKRSWSPRRLTWKERDYKLTWPTPRF